MPTSSSAVLFVYSFLTHFCLSIPYLRVRYRKVIVIRDRGRPRSAPDLDGVATTAVSGGAVAAVAAVATAPRSQADVASRPDAGQQLALSPAAGDHVATVARPQKKNVAALRSPDVVTTNTASRGYRRVRTPQRSQLCGTRPTGRTGTGREQRVSCREDGRKENGAMGTFTASQSTTGRSTTGTSATGEQARWKREPREQAQDGRPSTATGAGDNAGKGRTFSGLCGRSILYAAILNTEMNKVISSFVPLFFYLIVASSPPPFPQPCSSIF